MTAEAFGPGGSMGWLHPAGQLRGHLSNMKPGDTGEGTAQGALVQYEAWGHGGRDEGCENTIEV